MHLLIEDPEWLQLRHEELLAIEDYNRDREWLLWVAPCRADLAPEEELRGCVKRFKESILRLEDVQRQMANLHQTYSAHLPLDFPDTLWVSQTLADCGREVSRVAQEFNGFEGLV